ncbi:hypothetical protein CALVIDRAFT_533113 [Calocera viscosa TUFC12733]|uniref:Uncharacterized protein n=1 Tax=Calocera viscosa (strain TUFC12733) TaxID=1330018 RepID=A0A167RCW8_CALVF|nr:hypothetical protein CALVIDRAFT_533113 [Calocera viscosa TUFC12733]
MSISAIGAFLAPWPSLDLPSVSCPDSGLLFCTVDLARPSTLKANGSPWSRMLNCVSNSQAAGYVEGTTMASLSVGRSYAIFGASPHVTAPYHLHININNDIALPHAWCNLPRTIRRTLKLGRISTCMRHISASLLGNRARCCL